MTTVTAGNNLCKTAIKHGQRLIFLVSRRRVRPLTDTIPFLMKSTMKSVLSLALLLAALWGGSLQTQAREVININRNWRFFSNSHTSDNATAVNLPHTWNRDAIGGHSDYYRGVGNYLKEIKIPEAWRGKRVFIRFGAGGTVASLVVNALENN